MATLSFRAPQSLLDETSKVLKITAQKRSDYIREAVAAKNARILADHIAALSHKLTKHSLSANAAMDATVADGLDG